MRGVALLLAIAAACGSRAPVAPPGPAVLAPIAPIAPIAATAARPVAAVPVAPVTRRVAPPVGPIREVALTAAADAALTVDDAGGLRLWPTLDGTREPEIIALPAARDAVIARRAAGFAIAIRDEAGGLVVAQVDDDGRVRARAAIAPDVGVAELVATEAGMLAWRVDGSGVLYRDDGAVVGTLTLEPGERLVALGAITGGALVVAVATDPAGAEQPRARTLRVAGGQLAWGAARAPGPDVSGAIAISPSGAYLARLVGPPRSRTPVLRGVGAGRVEVIELASGRVVASRPADTDGAVAFADDAHVVIEQGGKMTWYATTGGDPLAVKHAAGPSPAGPPPFAAAAGVAVAAGSGQLVIARGPADDAVRYLGYGAHVTSGAAADGHGALVALLQGGVTAPVLAHVDRDLQLGARIAGTDGATGVARLPGDRWLVGWLLSPTDQVAVVDPSATPALGPPLARRARELLTEPTTDLVGLIGTQPALYRYDAAARSLAAVPLVPVDAVTYPWMTPVAPALAGGTRVVRARTTPAPLHIEWLRDESGPATTSIDVRAAFGSVDRAGHAYVWPDHNSLAIYRDGAQVATVAGLTRATVWPDPDGARFAAQTAAGLALYGVDGTLRWQSLIPRPELVLWLDATTLVVFAQGGLARVDAATGAVLAARCGWDFQLSAQPIAPVQEEPRLCAELPAQDDQR